VGGERGSTVLGEVGGNGAKRALTQHRVGEEGVEDVQAADVDGRLCPHVGPHEDDRVGQQRVPVEHVAQDLSGGTQNEARVQKSEAGE
jgi:hypothetical protein